MTGSVGLGKRNFTENSNNNNNLNVKQQKFNPSNVSANSSSQFFTATSTLTATVNATVTKVVNLIPKLIPMEIESNTVEIMSKMEKAIQEHRSGDCKDQPLLIHTPEMSISAYDCGDLFQVNPEKFNQRIENSLAKFIAITQNNGAALPVSVTVGFPFYTQDGNRVILHALISDGKILSIKGKEELANNIGRNRGVEYEVRYFVPCLAGTQIRLNGTDFTYETGNPATNSIFSDAPVEIAGQKIALVICEEMFTGSDNLDKVLESLDKSINSYLKTLLNKAFPHHHLNDTEYSAFKSFLKRTLDQGQENSPEISRAITNRFQNHPAGLQLFKTELDQTFLNFQEKYLAQKKQGYQTVEDDIKSKGRLYKQLHNADIILVPNGSPSATGKYNTRELLLSLNAKAYQSEMKDNAPPKQIYYSNHNGIQAGSIAYDGTVIKTDITKENVSVTHLNSYHYGLVGNTARETPHWATTEGQQKIADAVNGTEYFSGKKLLNIGFGDATKNIYPKLYQEVEYAYSNLLKLISSSIEGKPGEIFEPGSKKYVGNFVSLSGGFDSAHTLIIRALQFSLRMRTLVKEVGSVSASLQTMKDELQLDKRKFNINTFCSSYLMQKVNDSNDLENKKLTYKNLQNMCTVLGIDSIVAEQNVFEKRNAVKSALERMNFKTIADFLNFVDRKMEDSSDAEKNEKIDLLSRLITFHMVKASYLRTENNSINTERGARLLAYQLGVDFEVRNVDVDFKTALLLEKGIDLSRYRETQKCQILNTYNQIMQIGKRSDREEQIKELEAKKRIISDPRYANKYNFTVPDIEARITKIHNSLIEDATKLKDLKSHLKGLLGKSYSPEEVDVYNWFESATGLEIENIQARVRAEKNWEIAGQQGFMPTSNPNSDEGKHGYTTFIGDLHAGKESSTADLRKIEILAEMAYLMQEGLHDSTQFFGKIGHLVGIYQTFKQPPSAELQQSGDDPLLPQQTDEDAYGMSYFVLSMVGDTLFKLSENGAHFIHISEVFAQFENHPIFHGHSKWEIYAKIDKVYRQWYFASFKRRAAPWQMVNSDVSVDHHANNRTEFAGFDNAIRHERTELLLTILHREGIVKGDLKALKENLLLNTQLQEKLQSIIWSNHKTPSYDQPNDLKVLIQRFAETPGLLNELINERVKDCLENGLIKTELLKIRAPVLVEKGAQVATLNAYAILGIPIAAKARDLSGNLYKAKEAILKAQAEEKSIVVIPEVLGTDLGDNLRRVDQQQINLLLQNLADFAKESAPNMAIVIGHPSYDETTKDRSYRYYQSATVIQAGQSKTFHASKIDNNNGVPGASYNTRTFQAYHQKQDVINIKGTDYYVLIGESLVPPHLHESTKIIHLGSMEAEDQINAVQQIGERLKISVNAFGSSSGIRSFNGRVIDDVKKLATYRETDTLPDSKAKQDAQWLQDYLPPFGKVIINLDSPEALYTLETAKRRVELLSQKPCNATSFNAQFEVVVPYYAAEAILTKNLWKAAESILGFSLPLKDNKHPTNQYEIDPFKQMFLKNTLLGDINMNAFSQISEHDTWVQFSQLIDGFLKAKSPAEEQQLQQLKRCLVNSPAFKNSLIETYNREQATLFQNVESQTNQEAYIEMQIELIIDRIKTYRPLEETADRLKSIFAWLLSARNGGEGQMILNNIARNDLCCAQLDLFGGRIHAGGATVTASRSLEEMRDVFKDTHVKALFDQKMEEEIVPGLSRKNVDDIYHYLVDHKFSLRGIMESSVVFNQGLNDRQKIAKLEKFVTLWEKNIWDRHAIPNSPHTKYSVDQQTSFREPLHSTWLRNELNLLNQRIEQMEQLDSEDLLL